MIYLLAGHTPDKSKGKYDPGAVANGYTEAEIVKETRELVSAILNVKHYIDNDSDSLSMVLSKVSSTEKDVIFDLHTNAGPTSATGVEVIIPKRHTTQECECAKSLSNELALAMGIRNRGVKTEDKTARGSLAVMRENGINILIELFFLTNKNDLDAYLANKHKCSEIIANHLIWAENQV